MCSECAHPVIVSELGHVYPYSMLGFQAADSDAYVKHSPPHKPTWNLKLIERSDWGLTLFNDALVLWRETRSEKGYTHWYPIHIRFRASRNKKRHFHIRTKTPTL